MVKIPYRFYSGAGNTFYLVDNREAVFPYSQEMIASLCDVDGMIFLENSSIADFRMRIFNADGSEAEMCGNGIRCLIDFIHSLGYDLPLYKIETGASMHIGLQEAVLVENEVRVQMGDPFQLALHQELEIPFGHFTFHRLNTGVPHLVIFLETQDLLSQFPVEKVGRFIRFHPFFSPAGTNVNFCHLDPERHLRIRTYERGVEAETLACGTGATASALVAHLLYGLSSPISVQVQSNAILKIFFKSLGSAFSQVMMQGPVQKLKDGVFELDLKENHLIIPSIRDHLS